jgi:hypothetical protein
MRRSPPLRALAGQPFEVAASSAKALRSPARSAAGGTNCTAGVHDAMQRSRFDLARRRPADKAEKECGMANVACCALHAHGPD